MNLRVLTAAAALTLAGAAQAQSSYPDLVVSAVPSFPATLAQGASAPVTLTIRNAGLADAAPFDVSVALTRDGGVCTQLIYCDDSDDDRFVGSATVASGLAAGAEVTVPVQITIPADLSAEAWNLFGVVDGPVLHGPGKVFESNETNNFTYGGPVQITVPQVGDPDLVVAAGASFPAVLAQGASAAVTLTVRNAGFSAAGPFAVSVALTRDGGVCTQLIYCDESDDDWFVGSTSVAGLAAGATVTVTVPISIPADLSPESWNVFGVADGPVLHGFGKVFEANETNNWTYEGAVLVTAP